MGSLGGHLGDTGLVRGVALGLPAGRTAAGLTLIVSRVNYVKRTTARIRRSCATGDAE